VESKLIYFYKINSLGLSL